MKKYRIVDADGEEYQIEELEEMKDEDIEEVEDEASEEALSPEEISALRRLASVADKLVAMVEQTDADEEESGIEENDLQDEEEIEEEKEEIIDTEEEEIEEMAKPRDSKTSFGAIEKTKHVADTSLVDDVADAWAKRYNGGK